MIGVLFILSNSPFLSGLQAFHRLVCVDCSHDGRDLLTSNAQQGISDRNDILSILLIGGLGFWFLNSRITYKCLCLCDYGDNVFARTCHRDYFVACSCNRRYLFENLAKWKSVFLC